MTFTLEAGSGFLRVASDDPTLTASIAVDHDWLKQSFGPGEPLAVDMLTVAAGVFALDRLVLRATTRDGWTRQFDLRVPVSNPDRWSAAATQLAECFRFLSSDHWRFEFTQRTADPFHSAASSKRSRVTEVQAMQLFSGGIDSYAGAIAALTGASRRLLLVGHQDQPGAPAAQRRLFDRILSNPAYDGRALLRTVRLAPVGQAAREPSSRSRSVVFIALGVYAMRALQIRGELVVPENGFITINPPLTLGRVGAASTRTTHPHFLAGLGRVMRAVGIEQGIANPWRFKTKGEVLEAAGDVDTLLAGVPDAVSCAHSGRRMHWLRTHCRNCGYCWPCLIRRAALHRLAADDGREYGVDILRGELPLYRDSAADLRALAIFLSEVRSDREIRDRILLTGPVGPDRSAYIEVVRRGINELRAWLSTGSDTVRHLISS